MHAHWALMNTLNASQLALSEGHTERVARAQSNLFLRIDLLVGKEGHAPPLGNSGNGENPFHPGEAFSDALTTSAAKGKVGEARTLGFSFFSVAKGIEP